MQININKLLYTAPHWYLNSLLCIHQPKKEEPFTFLSLSRQNVNGSNIHECHERLMHRGVKILKSCRPNRKKVTALYHTSNDIICNWRNFSKVISKDLFFLCKNCRPNLLKLPPISGGRRPFLTSLHEV